MDAYFFIGLGWLGALLIGGLSGYVFGHRAGWHEGVKFGQGFREESDQIACRLRGEVDELAKEKKEMESRVKYLQTRIEGAIESLQDTKVIS